jgi:hypothetical protein
LTSFEHKGLIPLLPARRVLFKQRGGASWKRHHFTILGDGRLLGAARSLKPMHLVLVTDIDGFRSTEVVGLDLFAAVASAMLTAESIIIMLQHSGEVQLREGTAFEVASDSVFFGNRVEALRQKFEAYPSEGTGYDTGSPTDT